MSAITVSTSAVKLNSAPGRLFIQNQHASVDLFVAPRSDVTTTGATRGLRILAGSDLTLFANADRPWYGITASSNGDVVTEMVA